MRKSAASPGRLAHAACRPLRGQLRHAACATDGGLTAADMNDEEEAGGISSDPPPPRSIPPSDAAASGDVARGDVVSTA